MVVFHMAGGKKRRKKNNRSKAQKASKKKKLKHIINLELISYAVQCVV